jgi:hypothetical protein
MTIQTLTKPISDQPLSFGDRAEEFPPDLFINMLSRFLTHEDWGRCNQVCRKWHQLTGSDALWQTIIPRDEVPSGKSIKTAVDESLVASVERMLVSLKSFVNSAPINQRCTFFCDSLGHTFEPRTPLQWARTCVFVEFHFTSLLESARASSSHSFECQWVPQRSKTKEYRCDEMAQFKVETRGVTKEEHQEIFDQFSIMFQERVKAIPSPSESIWSSLVDAAIVVVAGCCDIAGYPAITTALGIGLLGYRTFESFKND